jgi:hypothetical protein
MRHTGVTNETASRSADNASIHLEVRESIACRALFADSVTVGYRGPDGVDADCDMLTCAFAFGLVFALSFTFEPGAETRM